MRLFFCSAVQQQQQQQQLLPAAAIQVVALMGLLRQVPAPTVESSCSLAAADGMEQVGRNWSPAAPAPSQSAGGTTKLRSLHTHPISVSLAKQETEAAQLVVLGGASGCSVARVEVPSLSGGPGTPPTVAIHPIGFVPNGPCPIQTRADGNRSCSATAPFRARDGSCVTNDTVKAGKAPGCSRNGPFPGAPGAPSWPFVLLPTSKWLTADGGLFDVNPSTAQPLMVSVTANNATSAGEWHSVVRVVDTKGTRLALDLHITVFDFTLPPASLPTLFGVPTWRK